MERLVSILESFYMREESRGVAFVGPTFADITFGRSPTAFLYSLQLIDGFVQLHFEGPWVSVYASSFGRGRWLIVQFPFQDEYPPPLYPWNPLSGWQSTCSAVSTIRLIQKDRHLPVYRFSGPCFQPRIRD